MTEIHDKLAALKAKYPDDVERIEADAERVRDLLLLQDYQSQEATQTLIKLCRTDILAARKKLATERRLTDEERAELWHIVDAREWFLKMVSRDFAQEAKDIEAELDAELAA